MPVGCDEGRVGRAAQQPIQLVQLAALALPADPAPFAFVPDPPTMEQQEAGAAGRRAIAPIEAGDARRRRPQAVPRRLRRARSRHRSSRTAERNEDRRRGSRGDGSPVARSAPRSPPRGQQRRHRDERAQMRGNAIAQVPKRAEASRRSPSVTPRFTNATAASMAGIAPRTPSRLSHAPSSPAATRANSGSASEDCGHNGDGSHVAADAESPVQPRRPHAQRRPVADRRFERIGVRRRADDSPDRLGALSIAPEHEVGDVLCCQDGAAGNVELRERSSRAPIPRSRCGRDCASGNPYP